MTPAAAIRAALGDEVRTFVSTIVYPPEPKWCGGPCTWRVRSRSAEEAAAVVHRLTEGRWAADPRSTPFVEETVGVDGSAEVRHG